MFTELICNDSLSLKTIINDAKASKSFGTFKTKCLHLHEILDTNSSQHKYLLFDKIIKKLHPNLYLDLEQIFELDRSKINFYQCRLNKEARLIFTIHKNSNNNEETFIPLIFDLNHCIYIKTDKNYDKNINSRSTEWDFKNDQERIKQYLL